MYRLAVIAASAVLFAVGAFVPAHADDARDVVNAAKARCEIGETVSGYLEVVEGASPEVVAAMNHINIQRRAVYDRLARQQNVDLNVVAQLTGERQVNRATAGQCVKDSSGDWKQV